MINGLEVLGDLFLPHGIPSYRLRLSFRSRLGSLAYVRAYPATLHERATA